MGDARIPCANQKVAHGLVPVGQHERGRSQHRAQEDLEAAVAADVVEGRPDRARLRRGGGVDAAGQPFKGVGDELRGAGGAGGGERPLRLPSRPDRGLEGGPGRGLDIDAGQTRQGVVGQSLGIADGDLGVRIRRDARDVFRREARGTRARRATRPSRASMARAAAICPPTASSTRLPASGSLTDVSRGPPMIPARCLCS